jgi:DNA-binding transcriptional regulator YhcF (GntR family)
MNKKMTISDNEKLVIEEMVHFVENNWKSFIASSVERGFDKNDIEESYETLSEKLYT